MGTRTPGTALGKKGCSPGHWPPGCTQGQSHPPGVSVHGGASAEPCPCPEGEAQTVQGGPPRLASPSCFIPAPGRGLPYRRQPAHCRPVRKQVPIQPKSKFWFSPGLGFIDCCMRLCLRLTLTTGLSLLDGPAKSPSLPELTSGRGKPLSRRTGLKGQWATRRLAPRLILRVRFVLSTQLR